MGAAPRSPEVGQPARTILGSPGAVVEAALAGNVNDPWRVRDADGQHDVLKVGPHLHLHHLLTNPG